MRTMNRMKTPVVRCTMKNDLLSLQDVLLLREENRHTWCLLRGGETVILAEKPETVLNRFCLRSGSSLSGRIESFCELLQVRQKAAVLISEKSGHMFFPLTGMKQPGCIWVSYNDLFHFRSNGPDRTILIFTDGTRQEVECNIRVIRKQANRCEAYLNLLQKEEVPDADAGRVMDLLQKNRDMAGK